MFNPNDQFCIEFAEAMAKELLEHGATEAAIVIRNETENRVVTNYLNTNFESRCVLIGYLLKDMVLGIIAEHADKIREILEGKQ
jgi:hypothetical protein